MNKHAISFVVEIEEKVKKTGEEKNEKENLQLFGPHKAAISIESTFHNHFCLPHVAPVMDHISPPPDAIV